MAVRHPGLLTPGARSLRQSTQRPREPLDAAADRAFVERGARRVGIARARRAGTTPRGRNLERIADILFLLRLAMMVAVAGLIAYEII